MTPPTVSLEVKYELGHSYHETWTQTSFRCPNCGEQAVWVNTGGGDFYEGPQHICSDCEHTFTLPRLDRCRDWQDKQRLEAFKATA